jgi:hypothetical protein
MTRIVALTATGGGHDDRPEVGADYNPFFVDDARESGGAECRVNVGGPQSSFALS